VKSMKKNAAAAIVTCLAGATAMVAIGRTPTAHRPQFDDRQVWPDLCGKERFLESTWPKGRLYVWVKRGGSTYARGATKFVGDQGGVERPPFRPALSGHGFAAVHAAGEIGQEWALLIPSPFGRGLG